MTPAISEELNILFQTLKCKANKASTEHMDRKASTVSKKCDEKMKKKHKVDRKSKNISVSCTSFHRSAWGVRHS